MLRDQLTLHFIVFIWGFTSVLGVLIALPSVELVFFRTILSVMGMGLLIYLLKKPLYLPVRKMVQLVLTGFLVAAHWILFFASAKISTVSICLSALSTTSLLTAFTEPLINRTRIKGYEVLFGMFAIAGIVTIFHFEAGYLGGLVLGLLAALAGALFSVLNGRFAKTTEPMLVSFYELAGAWLATALFFPFYQHFMSETGTLQLTPSWADWGYLLILSLVCTVYPFYTSVELLKRISAFNVNLIVNLEPVYGILLALVLFGEKEQMSPGFYAGGMLILVSVLLYPFIDRRLRYRRERANAR